MRMCSRTYRIGTQYYRYDLNGNLSSEQEGPFAAAPIPGRLWFRCLASSSTASNIDIPWRFTEKERDDETGLYYYGARYLDSRTGRWLSAKPALGDYIPGAPVNDEARQRNQSLPGMGGVFNVVNLHLYHYAGNNPVKYVDPDGNDFILPILILGIVAAVFLKSDVTKSPSVDRDGILRGMINMLDR